MATCPNKTLQSWKDLVNSKGEDMAYYLWDKYEGNIPESEYAETAQVKPGVSELFESNPELANAVYEALGFEIPTIKLEGKKFDYGEPTFFDIVTELTSGERNKLPSSILIKKLLDGEFLPTIKDSQIILGLSEAGMWRPNLKKIEASGENKSTLAKKVGHELLHSVTNNIILSYQNLKGVIDFNDKYNKDFIKQGYIKPVNLTKSQIEALDNLVKIRNKVVAYVEQNKDKIQKQDRGFGTYDYFIRTNYTESETDLHEFISEVFTNPELINILKEIPTEGKKSNLFKDFVDAIAKILGFTNTSILEDIIAYSEEAFFAQPQITPQQKQQAQQLYSQYLDTIFPDSKVKDIVYRGGEKNDSKLFQYWTNNKVEAYVYAKYNITKGGNITERNPIDSIKTAAKEYFIKKYNNAKILNDIYDLDIKGINTEKTTTKKKLSEIDPKILKDEVTLAFIIGTETKETQIINDFITKGTNPDYLFSINSYFKKSYDNSSKIAEKYNIEKKDVELLYAIQEVFKKYKYVKIESEQDLMKQYDDTGYIKNIDDYNKARKYIDNVLGVKNIKQNTGKITTALLNIKNPYTEEIRQEDLYKDGAAYKNGHDGAFLMDGDHFLVKNNTNQVYELGTKQDIQGFKEFVKSPEGITMSPETDELSLYLSNKMNENFKISNPKLKGAPSIDDIVTRHVPTSQTDIDNKKEEC